MKHSLKNLFTTPLITLLLIVLLFFSCKTSNKSSDSSISSNKKTLTNPQREYTSKQLSIDGLFLDACTQKELGNLDKALSLYDEVIKQDETYAAAYFDKASILFNKRDVKESIALTNKAISLDSKNIWYRLQLIQIYLNTSDFGNAAKEYENIIKINPEEKEYYQELAEVYNRNGDYDNMLKTLNQIEKKWGPTEELSMIKFRYYMQQKEYEKAEKEIENIQKTSSEQTPYLAILAEINMTKKNYSKALEYYKQIEEINPQDPYINVSFANLYYVQNDKAQVYHYLNKAIKNKNLDFSTKIQVLLTIYAKTVDDNPEDFKHFFTLLEELAVHYPQEKAVWELLSTGYMKTSQFEKAVQSIRTAIQIGEASKGKQPNEFELYQNLLFALSALGEQDSVIKESQKSIELFPEQPVPYLFLGINQLYKANYIESKAVLTQGLSLVVDNKALLEDFYSNLGEVCYKLDQSQEAFTYFDKTLEINPNNYIILNNYAYYLSLKETNLDKAEQMAKKAFDKFPDQQTFVDTYAWVLYKKKDHKGAYQAMQSIIKQKDSWSQTIKEHYDQILEALNP
jgi:tetratricopeptide (TPR) repeat protein